MDSRNTLEIKSKYTYTPGIMRRINVIHKLQIMAENWISWSFSACAELQIPDTLAFG